MQPFRSNTADNSNNNTPHLQPPHTTQTCCDTVWWIGGRVWCRCAVGDHAVEAQLVLPVDPVSVIASPAGGVPAAYTPSSQRAHRDLKVRRSHTHREYNDGVRRPTR